MAIKIDNGVGIHDHSSSSQGGATLNVQDSTFTIQDSLDTTRRIQLFATNTSPSTTRIFLFPDSNGTLMITDDIINSDFILFGDWLFQGILDCSNASSVLLNDNVTQIVGSTDSTKRARFEVDGFTTASAHTFTLPDSSMIVAGININQAWSTGTQTFSQDIVTFEADTGANYFVLKDLDSGFAISLVVSATLTNDFQLRIPPTTDSTADIVTTSAQQTLTNKTLSVTNNVLRAASRTSGVSFADNTTTTKRLRVLLSGLTASTDNLMDFKGTAERTWTFPDATGVVVQAENVVSYDDDIVMYEDEIVLAA